MICPTFNLGIVNSEWVAPPSDLKGLVAMPNGIMAGFSGNNICFSEPFFPHAWPIRYRLATNFSIVSMGRYGQTLIVTTKGFPYAVVGARPDSANLEIWKNGILLTSVANGEIATINAEMYACCLNDTTLPNYFSNRNL